MNKQTLIGFLLIGAILIIFSQINKKPEDTSATKTFNDSALTGEVTSLPDSAVLISSDSSLVDSSTEEVDSTSSETDKGEVIPELFATHVNKDVKYVTLENEKIKVRISTEGGRVAFAELKDYKTFNGKPLILFKDGDSDFGYEFAYQNYKINSSDLSFETGSDSQMVTEGSSAKAVFKLELSEDQYIEHIYTLEGNTYMVGFNINMVGFENIIPKNNPRIDFKWIADTRQLERKQSAKNSRLMRNSTTIFYKFKEEVPDKLSETKDERVDFKGGDIKWVSFKQPFFNQTLILDNFNTEGGETESLTIEDSNYEKKLATTLVVRFGMNDLQSYNMRYYFGPNHFKTLKKYDLDLERLIFLGRGILRGVNTVLIIPVFNFLNRSISNYGIIILLLTIFIKLILLPLTFKSYKSTAKMKVLKPEIDAIKKKVGNDPTKVQTEQMKLYKKAGVSPLGGCLPMLLQMPILIAMFRFFPSSIELRQESFLWAHDLSTYDSIYNFPNGFSIPFYGDHVSLFTLLMTISTIIYTRTNSQMMGGDTQKQMRIIQYIMPIMFLGFFNNYSAGLSYYYFLANIITFGQQYLFKLFIDEDKLRKKIEETKKKRAGKGPSKWQKRLEDLQKQQQKRKR